MGLTIAEFGYGLLLIFFSVVLTSFLWWLITLMLNLKEKGFMKAFLVVSASNAPLVLSLLLSTGYAEGVLGGLSSTLSLLFLPASLLALFYAIKSLYGWKKKRAFLAFLIIFFCSLLSYLLILLVRPPI